MSEIAECIVTPDSNIKIYLKYIPFIELFLRKLLYKKYLVLKIFVKKTRLWAVFWVDEWMNDHGWELCVSVSHQSDMTEATISNNSNCRLKRWIMCVNPSLFLYKHWERYSCGYLILIFPMLSSLWLRSGLCRWISKQFRSRIFNQPKIYSLLPTITL